MNSSLLNRGLTIGLSPVATVAALQQTVADADAALTIAHTEKAESLTTGNIESVKSANAKIDLSEFQLSKAKKAFAAAELVAVEAGRSTAGLLNTLSNSVKISARNRVVNTLKLLYAGRHERLAIEHCQYAADLIDASGLEHITIDGEANLRLKNIPARLMHWRRLRTCRSIWRG
jgi:hypothetical protein